MRESRGSSCYRKVGAIMWYQVDGGEYSLLEERPKDENEGGAPPPPS